MIFIKKMLKRYFLWLFYGQKKKNLTILITISFLVDNYHKYFNYKQIMIILMTLQYSHT